jgi:hypothetical protein
MKLLDKLHRRKFHTGGTPGHPHPHEDRTGLIFYPDNEQWQENYEMAIPHYTGYYGEGQFTPVPFPTGPPGSFPDKYRTDRAIRMNPDDYTDYRFDDQGQLIYTHPDTGKEYKRGAASGEWGEYVGDWFGEQDIPYTSQSDVHIFGHNTGAIENAMYLTEEEKQAAYLNRAQKFASASGEAMVTPDDLSTYLMETGNPNAFSEVIAQGLHDANVDEWNACVFLGTCWAGAEGDSPGMYGTEGGGRIQYEGRIPSKAEVLSNELRGNLQDYNIDPNFSTYGQVPTYKGIKQFSGPWGVTGGWDKNMAHMMYDPRDVSGVGGPFQIVGPQGETSYEGYDDTGWYGYESIPATTGPRDVQENLLTIDSPYAEDYDIQGDVTPVNNPALTPVTDPVIPSTSQTPIIDSGSFTGSEAGNIVGEMGMGAPRSHRRSEWGLPRMREGGVRLRKKKKNLTIPKENLQRLIHNTFKKQPSNILKNLSVKQIMSTPGLTGMRPDQIGIKGNIGKNIGLANFNLGVEKPFLNILRDNKGNVINVQGAGSEGSYDLGIGAGGKGWRGNLGLNYMPGIMDKPIYRGSLDIGGKKGSLNVGGTYNPNIVDTNPLNLSAQAKLNIAKGLSANMGATYSGQEVIPNIGLSYRRSFEHGGEHLADGTPVPQEDLSAYRDTANAYIFNHPEFNKITKDPVFGSVLLNRPKQVKKQFPDVYKQLKESDETLNWKPTYPGAGADSLQVARDEESMSRASQKLGLDEPSKEVQNYLKHFKLKYGDLSRVWREIMDWTQGDIDKKREEKKKKKLEKKGGGRRKYENGGKSKKKSSIYEKILKYKKGTVSHALDALGMSGNFMAEAAEGIFNVGDQEFNPGDIVPEFKGDFSFTNQYGKPVKSVSQVTGLDDWAQENYPVAKWLPGLSVDIATDPLSYIGAGIARNLMKKGATKVPTLLRNVDDVVKSGNKGNLKKYLNSQGLTLDDLTRTQGTPGTSLTTYNLGDDSVLKVPIKGSDRGIYANTFNPSEELTNTGRITKILDRGDDFMVTEKVIPYHRSSKSKVWSMDESQLLNDWVSDWNFKGGLSYNLKPDDMTTLLNGMSNPSKYGQSEGFKKVYAQFTKNLKANNMEEFLNYPLESDFFRAGSWGKRTNIPQGTATTSDFVNFDFGSIMGRDHNVMKEVLKNIK